ncbi:hypothetical protein AB0I28_33755 [Phytomonospora sp. NPDC050363]|uniref:hypothetical protein n=1 Tax=Phytomonospora sp. NPDC050363 TaxID=3155642 RepID=UPI0033F530A9
MGFHVDLEQLAGAESTLRGLSKNGEDAAALAADSDPDWFVWGALGSFLASSYFTTADEVHGHLKSMHEALDAHAERIKICADSYRVKEEDNKTTMDAIQRRLDGK